MRGHEQHAAEHVALGEDGRGDGDGVALVGVDDRQRAAVGQVRLLMDIVKDTQKKKLRRNNSV